MSVSMGAMSARVRAPQTSWVLHRGGSTRGEWLADTNHSAVFAAKHGVTHAQFRRQVLRRCHPAVVEEGLQVLFPVDEAPPPPQAAATAIAI